jgi:hypothetical protein
MQGWGFGMPFWVEGTTNEQSRRPAAGFKMVTPGYFRALGMRLRKGRGLTAADVKNSVPVMVINETFADEIAAWNAACTSDECRIALPPRSGRSLTWWGTDPRLMEQVNESCSPQPGCRVPDGDLVVWNFDCSPQPTCRVRLSRAY